MNRNALVRARRLTVVLVVVVAVCLLAGNTAWAAKNVILMIADGSGHNSWLAASIYRAKLGKEVYDQPGWRRFACSTYPLNLSAEPTGGNSQDQSLLYDPQKAWDATPLAHEEAGFAGYEYLATTATDSAAAATALATGYKTYHHAINWLNDRLPLHTQTIAEIAKVHRKSTGVVTSVQWSDATPAALGGAHNVSRSNHAQIANEMLDSGCLDVIMGAGNPDYDANGQPLTSGQNRDYQWVGGQETWLSLKQGQPDWMLIESKTDFEALATGPAPPKVLGTTWRGGKPKAKQSRNRATPNAVSSGRNSLALATMTRAALHCLEQNPKGFYLMIEGGAVDWANHANQPGWMIEEQTDFVAAVEAVVDWVNKNSNWDDTLVILTADHECGLLWGPRSDRVAFDPIQDNGPGRLPGMKYHSDGHSNSLVPLYARGPGSERFAELIHGADPKAAAVWHFSGKYVDNTDVFAVMKAEVTR
jgi:alkaline phosphatase